MPTRASLTRATLPSLIGGLLLLAVATWFAYGGVRASLASRALVEHTLEVQVAIGELRSAVQRAESAQRGQLLTGEDRYGEPYRDARQSAQAAHDRLRLLTVDNPKQQAALDRLQPLMTAKFAEMDRTLELEQAGKADEALAIVRTDNGLRQLIEIRDILNGMRATEDELLRQRSGMATVDTHKAFVATAIAALGILVLGGAAVVAVARSQRALRDTNAGLEEEVERRTADLREANEEVQRFAYIVSHDLRSPLVNVMGFASELDASRQDLAIALRDAPDPMAAKVREIDGQIAESIAFIRAATTKMDRLINAILRLSREGRRAFGNEKIDMNQLIDAQLRAVEHQVKETDASIQVSGLPPIFGDRLALEQVFGNLIDNAIKYRDPTRKLSIEIAGRAQGDRVVYEVRDTGRGIAPEDRERVFELFRRAGAQTQPGEGIGLAHVRAMVRRMEGSIDLQSEPGAGTTFIVDLPRQAGRVAGRAE
ncbi:sensor histidine kinase [Roseiterribacter gracilis]|uniref:histidine kinase n=1 Tax=Roseiterribacter gracilis TaxID=2812848 RepID=A0A8S8XAA0_9PROT|nr:histidine kinase [Rhodospirillales bacterium TMPK1]